MRCVVTRAHPPVDGWAARRIGELTHEGARGRKATSRIEKPSKMNRQMLRCCNLLHWVVQEYRSRPACVRIQAGSAGFAIERRSEDRSTIILTTCREYLRGLSKFHQHFLKTNVQCLIDSRSTRDKIGTCLPAVHSWRTPSLAAEKAWRPARIPVSIAFALCCQGA